MLWLYLTLTSVFLFTIEGLLQRVLAVDSKNQRALGFLFAITAALIALLLNILTGQFGHFILPTEPFAYVALIIAFIAYGLYDRYRFKAAQMVQASTFATLGTTSVVVAFFISAFLNQEQITLNKILGLLFILVALLMVSYEPTKKKENISLTLFLCIVVGIAWALDKTGINYFNLNTYNLLVWTFPAIFTYLPYIKKKDIKYEFNKASWKIILLAGLNVGAYFCQLQAVALSEATKVIPLIQTYVFTTVICGIIFLKERNSISKKLIASVIAVIGSILLI